MLWDCKSKEGWTRVVGSCDIVVEDVDMTFFGTGCLPLRIQNQSPAATAKSVTATAPTPMPTAAPVLIPALIVGQLDGVAAVEDVLAGDVNVLCIDPLPF